MELERRGIGGLLISYWRRRRTGGLLNRIGEEGRQVGC